MREVVKNRIYLNKIALMFIFLIRFVVAIDKFYF